MAEPQRKRNPAHHDQPEARQLAEMAEMARAVEANWCAAWASLGLLRHPPRSFVDDTATLLRVVTPGLPETLMNIVMRYRAPEPVTAADIEETIAPFRRYGLPFQWWLIRDDAPHQVDQGPRATTQVCEPIALPGALLGDPTGEVVGARDGHGGHADRAGRGARAGGDRQAARRADGGR